MTDLSLADIYNQKVDIYTLLPALAYPLLEKSEDQKETTLAVLEIAMKERNRGKLVDRVETVDPEVYSGDTSEYVVGLFCQMVKNVFLNLKERIGDHDIEGDEFIKLLDGYGAETEEENVKKELLRELSNESGSLSSSDKEERKEENEGDGEEMKEENEDEGEEREREDEEKF